MRVGIGYDVHRLTENRKLILGGVEIEHTMGLLGHSDADVLVHAIMDALLGAASLGDIGKHFPDILRRWSRILPGFFQFPRSRLMSRQLRRKGLDLPGGKKGSLHRRSVL